MLSDEFRKAIDKLSHKELIEEINKGHRSRFQGDGFDYVKTRLAHLEKQEGQHQAEQHLSLNAESNKIAREANELAREANKTSSNAYCMSILSVFVAIVAALISLLPQCATKL